MTKANKKVNLAIKDVDGAARYAFDIACKSLNPSKGEIISEMMLLKAIEVLGPERVEYLLQRYAKNLELDELLKKKSNSQPPEPL
ncbi:hypothetical protein W03_18010 [Nitrosomonas sp. PY1]|uniref:hypothetical protein n=1 Tax=Nitrosomonas sp. PY1 TaxID=1803906 RepID=UPI001FC8A272|nr:hypothetical protein [Nitrosomonas sp. PY1]GKS69797.1 hypothetical protein W03_18010 [Nitrosomonas sp. PY1]